MGVNIVIIMLWSTTNIDIWVSHKIKRTFLAKLKTLFNLKLFYNFDYLGQWFYKDIIEAIIILSMRVSHADYLCNVKRNKSQKLRYRVSWRSPLNGAQLTAVIPFYKHPLHVCFTRTDGSDCLRFEGLVVQIFIIKGIQDIKN